jgi:hypothetical protein
LVQRDSDTINGVAVHRVWHAQRSVGVADAGLPLADCSASRSSAADHSGSHRAGGRGEQLAPPHDRAVTARSTPLHIHRHCPRMVKHLIQQYISTILAENRCDCRDFERPSHAGPKTVSGVRG